MGTRYKDYFSTRNTRQEQKLPGREQVKNSDGFYVFDIGDWQRLERFLILGSEGGSYYASERKLTVDNAEAAMRCIEENGLKAVDKVVEISDAGRAPSNDPALFVLAMAAKLGDLETRRAALAALPRVARIPTHLFHFVAFAEGFGGWGRAFRRAVANWYTEKKPGQLAYHLIKYQARDGWSNRDLLRLSHAVPKNGFQSGMFHWVTNNDCKSPIRMDDSKAFDVEQSRAARVVAAFEHAKQVSNTSELIELISEHNLPREAIPTKFLREPEVWDALLGKMPLGAMVRNLGNMSKVGLLVPMSAASKHVVNSLTNLEALKKSRLHPLQLLMALNTYAAGRGVRGSSTWTPVGAVKDAIEEAFYLSFGNLESTGKNHLLCIDTSGSMTWHSIAGMQGITPRVAAAVMAMVTARTERNSLFISYSDKASEMPITAKWNLEAAIERVGKFPAYGTNCAAPIEHAIKRGYDVDTIVLYTDSETNARGARQPVVALRDLRQKLGHDVKLIVVGMESNGFTVADPKDSSMLDVVGFDTAAPQLITQFSAGQI